MSEKDEKIRQMQDARLIVCQLIQVTMGLKRSAAELRERKYRRLRSILRRGAAGADVLACEIAEELDWLGFLHGDQTETTPSPSNESQ